MGYRQNIYNKYMNFFTKKYWKHPKKKCEKAIWEVFTEEKEAGGYPKGKIVSPTGACVRFRSQV